MAILARNIGSGSNNTAATASLSSIASNLRTGSLVILAIAYDNSGTSGADPYTTITDTKGNAWTASVDRLNDPGAASAGAVLRIFTTRQNAGTLNTSDTIRVTFGTTSTTAKAWTLTEASSSISGLGLRIVDSSGSIYTSNTSSVAVNVTNGGMLFVASGREANTTRTGDSDTVSGSWSTALSTGVGTTTAGMEIISQYKIVTGTTTQNYAATFGTSADGAIAYIEIEELKPPFIIQWIGDEDYQS